jgi:hypothetical protein
MKKIVCIFLFTVLITNVNAQKNLPKAWLVKGLDYTYTIKPPTGWVGDDTSGRAQNLPLVFYPKTERWHNAVTAFYTSTWLLKDKETINDVMNADMMKYMQTKIPVANKPDIKLQDNVVARIREVMGDADGNYEEIAYITQKNFVVLLVMTSRNKKDFYKTQSKFIDVVKSYKLIK